MRRALSEGNWELAGQLLPQALIAKPRDPDVLTDAARTEAMNGRTREAALLLVDAAAVTDYEPTRVEYAVRALIEVGELYRVIDLLEQAVATRPNDDAQRLKLVGFLKEAQLNDRIEPHYRILIQHRSFDLPFLVALTDSSRRKFSAEVAERMLERNPQDRRPLLGEARDLIEKREPSEARRVLEDILEHHPKFAPAHALLGQVMIAEDRLDELAPWFAEAPPESQQYVEYWLTLGDLAADDGEYARASRAYWEATRLAPNDGMAWARLAGSLQHLRGASSKSIPDIDEERLLDIEARIEDLLQFRRHLTSFYWSHHKSQRRATEVARSLAKLGRNWEAEAWAAVATTLTDDPADDLAELRSQIIEDLRADPSWLSGRASPALTIDLSALPQPTTPSESLSKRRRLVPRRSSADHLRMSEESGAWGLGEIGANTNPGDAKTNPLARSTGAGGGAVDYDLDGHVDAIVMGAGGSMLKSDSMPDELLRNLGQRFERVTDPAGGGHTEFGQGVAVGDFNEDGFPDLFLANLGKNRLLRNNGDGTFSDCSHLLQDGEAKEWTTCGAFVDINLDGISDLFAVNYCSTEGNPDLPCPNRDGELGPCHPLRFAAAGNQFFAGTPHGRLEDKTSSWVSNVTPGRSMGILAGTLFPGKLGVFVANDMSANEFYSLADDGSEPLIESAALRGIAVDRATRPQASMGIASGDLDGDEDLDLYVTGFAKEYNIYYEQVTPGCWRDVSHRLGLVKPVLTTVGFGTEAIDLDDDGIEELIVTNGHIGDFEDGVYTYRQPLQIFRRNAEGKFEVVEDDGWGGYFSGTHVGRALWTMDADGDGRSDIMITHMHQPVRLLVNRTPDEHHRIAFKLVGTDDSRDAVGAVVRFRSDGRKRVLWRLSGDGYQCSNEPILRAGLGPAESVDEVTVTWPNGSVESLGTLPADAQYLVVQGSGTAFVME